MVQDAGAASHGHAGEANIGPRDEITALAVGFGRLVPDDTITVERRVETVAGALTFEFPVAGLASWLCLKADAIMRRDKPNDAYDVARPAQDNAVQPGDVTRCMARVNVERARSGFLRGSTALRIWTSGCQAGLA